VRGAQDGSICKRDIIVVGAAGGTRESPDNDGNLHDLSTSISETTGKGSVTPGGQGCPATSDESVPSHLSRCQAVEARPDKPPRREDRGGRTVLVARLLFIFISDVTLMAGSQTARIGKSAFPGHPYGRKPPFRLPEALLPARRQHLAPGPCTWDCHPLTLDFRPKTIDARVPNFGLWALGFGPWTLDFGLRTPPPPHIGGQNLSLEPVPPCLQWVMPILKGAGNSLLCSGFIYGKRISTRAKSVNSETPA
jgi:hypothetical protein